MSPPDTPGEENAAIRARVRRQLASGEIWCDKWCADYVDALMREIGCAEAERKDALIAATQALVTDPDATIAARAREAVARLPLERRIDRTELERRASEPDPPFAVLFALARSAPDWLIDRGRDVVPVEAVVGVLRSLAEPEQRARFARAMSPLRDHELRRVFDTQRLGLSDRELAPGERARLTRALQGLDMPPDPLDD